VLALGLVGAMGGGKAVLLLVERMLWLLCDRRDGGGGGGGFLPSVLDRSLVCGAGWASDASDAVR
jgi:hypothetical protein